MSTFTFGARPPAEVVSYLEDKVVGGRLSFDYRDVQREEHLVSFVVAKMMSEDLLGDVHASLVAAAKAGQTTQQWARDLTPLLQAKGWWGKAIQADPLTGEQQLVQLGSPARLQTIFGTNMRMANSAGRWERFMRSAATRPYLTYKHTPQTNPRLDHQAWDGIRLPINHVFWQTHCCPNGYHCKCYFVSDRKGPITSVEELEKRGVFETRPFRNKRTGEEIEVPVGVDPGFGYNVGQARLSNLVPPPMTDAQRDQVVGPRTPRTLPAAPRARSLPDGVRLREDLGGADAETVFQAFSKVLGTGEGEVFIDRAQIPLVIGRRLFERQSVAEGLASQDLLGGRAAYAEILAQALKDPDEIWHAMQTRPDGSSVVVRNYLASFKAGGDRQTLVASFYQRDGVWWGRTSYPPRPGDQANADVRAGALVYRRG